MGVALYSLMNYSCNKMPDFKESGLWQVVRSDGVVVGKMFRDASSGRWYTPDVKASVYSESMFKGLGWTKQEAIEKLVSLKSL